MRTILEAVREYIEEYPVYLTNEKDKGRLVIEATNEGSYSCTQIDLVDLLTWVINNKPELINDTKRN